MEDESPLLSTLDESVLEQIARRMGKSRVTRLPQIGIINAVYALDDDLILRVPREGASEIASALRESIAVPLAKGAGVRTPELIYFDDARSLLPVPYMVYERVKGETLELLGLEPEATPQVWRELGVDYARLHTGVTRAEENTQLEAPPFTPPQELVEELASKGVFTVQESTWLQNLIGPLATHINQSENQVFCHGDAQGTNIMVTPGTYEYLAVIDWGSVTWANPAHEFRSLPMRAVPFVFEGYRSVTDIDDEFEARILWWQLQSVFSALHRDPLPNLSSLSWAERPMSQLFELIRFLSNPSNERWLHLTA